MHRTVATVGVALFFCALATDPFASCQLLSHPLSSGHAHESGARALRCVCMCVCALLHEDAWGMRSECMMGAQKDCSEGLLRGIARWILVGLGGRLVGSQCSMGLICREYAGLKCCSIAGLGQRRPSNGIRMAWPGVPFAARLRNRSDAPISVHKRCGSRAAGRRVQLLPKLVLTHLATWLGSQWLAGLGGRRGASRAQLVWESAARGAFAACAVERRARTWVSGWDQGFGCWEFVDMAWVIKKWRRERACRGAARAASVGRCRSRCVGCMCGRAACAVCRRPAWRRGRRARAAHKYRSPAGGLFFELQTLL